MGELLDYFEKKQRAGIGPFFMTVIQQAEEQERQQLLAAAKQKPTAAQIESAHRQLNFIFSGDNQAEAEAFYQQGLHDVVGQRETEAATFYIHVENLTGTANQAHDQLKPNEA